MSKFLTICFAALACYLFAAILSAQTRTQLERAANNVTGWSKQSTRDGEFKSLVSLHAGGTTPAGDQWTEDQIYAVVERTIDGNDYTFIEQFTPVDWGSDDDYCWFVDGGGAGATFTPAVDAVYGDGDYTEYFVACQTQAATTKYIVNATTNETIDTSWGASGYWNGPHSGGVTYDILQLSDGRILATHTGYQATMIKADGTTDTSWGSSGSYTMPHNTEIRAVLQDNDGNFHLFAGVSDTGYTYVKIDSDGSFVTGITGQYYKLRSFSEASWSDENKTRIIAVGAHTNIRKSYYGGGSGFVKANMMAIKPDGAVDTDWTGNAGLGGFAQSGGQASTESIENMRITDDGGIVIYRVQTDVLGKMLADGSGYDTSWAINGELEWGMDLSPLGGSNKIIADGNEVYFVAPKTVSGSGNCVVVRVDEDGVVSDSYNIVAAQYRYHSIQKIDDNIYIGTNSQGGSKTIEIFDLNLDYVSGFDITTTAYVFYILPDETTRESILVTPAVPESYGTQDDDQLDGAEVCVYADGVSYGTFTMDGNDILGFAEEDYTVVIAGINYWSKLETVPLSVGPRLGSKKLSAIRFDLDDSYYLEYALGANATPIVCDFGEVITSSIKYERVTFPFGSYQKPTIYIQTDEPVPLGIRAVIPELTWYSPW